MSNNKFRIFFDNQTIGMNRKEKARFRLELKTKLKVTEGVFANWLQGKTIPGELQQFAINKILNTKIY